ncbi:hypothetical protein IJ768_03510 [Candidatus Saccharibacteria bacterium]|nr:hypothetical protein [Candidatus Saccharibacteria bacterium]
MKKSRLPSFLALCFATFLVFAALETFLLPNHAASASDSDSLEVPLTGEIGVSHTAETYESLFEIAFLALTGLGFYLLNTRREERKS